jgi:hypothetical protein
MNDKFPHGSIETILTVLSLGVIGALIGLGKLLDSTEPVSLRKAAGRAIVTSGLSMSGALILLVFPSTPILVVLGAGAALASLGTSFLESVISKRVGLK